MKKQPNIGKARSSGGSGSGESLAGELGFTLIELMIASVLALILLLTTTTILLQTVEFAERQRLRPVLNDKAREIFDLLGDGGCCDAINSPPEPLLGMRDRSTFSQGRASDLRNAYRLQLDNPSNGAPATVIGPEISQLSINCRANGDPVQDCVGTGTQTVRGYLARDPRLYVDTDSGNATSDRSLDDAERGTTNRTIEVEILLVQPHQANRTRFRSDQVRESYRSIFTLNRSQ